MFRFLTAGESHGQGITVIIEGIPAGLEIYSEEINFLLSQRQTGYGRGGRMHIEKDHVRIISGVRFRETIGSPITIFIENKDWVNWQDIMSVEIPAKNSNGRLLQMSLSQNPNLPISAKAAQEQEIVTAPRPGHADLAGLIKYNRADIRDILERASARETAARVAVGAICKRFLQEFEIDIVGYVLEIAGIKIKEEKISSPISNFKKFKKTILASELRCPDKFAESRMKPAIDKARENGDSLGGIFEINTTLMPIGLGSFSQWDRRLDGRIAQAIMSIPAIKGVEIGSGFANSRLFGSMVHDEIFPETPTKSNTSRKIKFCRKTNNAGGLEGGITNGNPLIVRGAMKPIPTLTKPLRTIDIRTGKAVKAQVERSDICAVSAASVVGEAMVAIIITDAFLEKFGGDNLQEIKRAFEKCQN